MAHSALLVAFLVLPAAPAERSLGDPAGEPALHRPGPVKGLVTETPGNIDALCSCLEHLVPNLRGRVHPSLYLQRLPAGLDPEPPVEVSDGTRDMFPRLHDSRRHRRAQQHLRIGCARSRIDAGHQTPGAP